MGLAMIPIGVLQLWVNYLVAGRWFCILGVGDYISWAD